MVYNYDHYHKDKRFDMVPTIVVGLDLVVECRVQMDKIDVILRHDYDAVVAFAETIKHLR